MGISKKKKKKQKNKKKKKKKEKGICYPSVSEMALGDGFFM